MKRLMMVVALCGLVAACETHEDNQIAKAQACLDDATQSTAPECKSMVDDINSTNAFLIRCSADFIAEGFDTTTMAKAFDQLQNSSGNQTTNMLSFLIFTNQASANAAYDDCSKSGVPSMSLLAGFAKTATLIANACTGTCTWDPTTDRGTAMPESEFLSGIDELLANPDPTVYAAIGSAVVLAYDTQCGSGANSSSAICTEIVKAMAGSKDPATIAANLLNNLKQ